MSGSKKYLRSVTEVIGPRWSYRGKNGGGHHVFHHPNGASIVTAHSPGDHRELRNLKALAARLERNPPQRRA